MCFFHIGLVGDIVLVEPCMSLVVAELCVHLIGAGRHTIAGVAVVEGLRLAVVDSVAARCAQFEPLDELILKEAVELCVVGAGEAILICQ